MKRLFIVVTTIILIVTMSTTAFARTFEDLRNTDTGNAVVSSITNTPIVYKVVVDWGSMKFDYSGNGTWDPEDHEYSKEGKCTAETLGISDKVTVTNHSNTSINAAFSFANSGGDYAGVSSKFSDYLYQDITNFDLDSAEGTLPDNAPSDICFVTLQGRAIANAKSGEKIGTITVRITDNNA